MLLAPPTLPHLSREKGHEILQFANPQKLKEGVVIKGKNDGHEKKIHSLYDLDLGTEYLVDGNLIRRISEKQVHVQRKPSFIPLMNTSTPIAIPVSSSPSIPIPMANRPAVEPRSALWTTEILDETSSNSPASPEHRATQLASPAKIRLSQESPILESFEDLANIPRVDPKSSSSMINIPFFPSLNGSTVFQKVSVIGSYSDSTPSQLIEASPKLSNSSFSLPASVSEDHPGLSIVFEIQTLPNERSEARFEEVGLICGAFKAAVPGCFEITNFRLQFTPNIDVPTKDMEFFRREFSAIFPPLEKPFEGIPLGCISRFEKVDRQNGHFMFGSGENKDILDIHFKDFRKSIRLIFDPTKQARKDVMDLLTKYASGCLADLAAVRSKGGPIDAGWNFWSPQKEFGRFGISSEKSSSGWIIVKQEKYSICTSYPEYIVVPDCIPEKDLPKIADFRSKGRIPVLCWRNKQNGVTLTRCAQPRAGFSGVYGSFRSNHDESIVKAIQKLATTQQKLLIVDARPMANAIANIVSCGGGYENKSNYGDCDLEFLGIANLHVVRDSYTKLKEICESICEPEIKYGWYAQLETSQWLNHMSTLLTGSVKIAKSLVTGSSVFVHCSDGWDRTPQLCCLAQIMVDPFYRTITGLCTVIEKEFIQMGHKFTDRCGFGSTEPMEERSPIFIQFLDAVWQLLRQFPSAFEFSEDFLIALADSLFSGRYGTFLCNSPKEREAERLSERSDSLWTVVFTSHQLFLNPFYAPASCPYILPATDPKNLQVWTTYYLRYLSQNVERECVNHYLRIGRDMKQELDSSKEKANVLDSENKNLRQELEELKAQLAHFKISSNGMGPVFAETKEADVVPLPSVTRIVGWSSPVIMDSYIQSEDS